MEVGALIRARQQIARTASTLHFAAIGQGNPYRGAKLLHITAELGDIIHRVPPISRSHRSWMVISVGSPGHGVPNREEPFESLFAMRDGPLTIRDIIQLRLRHWVFAFLSACHTTVGHASSPDELIHLVAATQFSGFRSVIGSMWSVNDQVVGQLVSAFYDNTVDAWRMD
ncbi:hypothetical protein M405DRAFT_930324 [Rhizopogon salebrosus TDB-379]|nr:hypothetical protein M405DRAFT_930324 [Rhizopogon salebrosus TDB-379]